MSNTKLNDLEEKFCLVYASGPSPYCGNAQKTYDLVYNKRSYKCKHIEEDGVSDEIDSSIKAHQLMKRDDIRDRIDAIQSEVVVNASTLKPRITETLLKIADECSTMTYKDKFGTELSPAAMRSVAVNAISKLSEIYGIKEDIAHKVLLEGADGEGITFNLIVPEKKPENEISDLMG